LVSTTVRLFACLLFREKRAFCHFHFRFNNSI